MELLTKLPLEKQSNNLIDYNSKIVLFGSCFSENIGVKLSHFKFQNFQNPFGILFHPKAIETLISHVVLEKQYSEADTFYSNEKWHCFDVHSKLSSKSMEDLVYNLNDSIEKTLQELKTATHIVITLGTAWVYRYIKTNQFVANCHKIPQKKFDKELLSVDAICQSLKHIVELINGLNSNTSVIFTVSPVRHLKDGFVENMQSKAHLISAIHEFLNQQLVIGENQSLYFPSYELMMDELRDYRFYNEDMIHPSPLAINYIWDKFKSVWISENAIKTITEVDAIQKGLQHRPFNPNSKAHQKFVENLEAKIEKVQVQFPHISF